MFARTSALLNLALSRVNISASRFETRQHIRRTVHRRDLPWIEVLKKRLQIHNCQERLCRPISGRKPLSDLSAGDTCYGKHTTLSYSD